MNMELDMVEHAPANLRSQHSLSEEGGGDRTWKLKGQLARSRQPAASNEIVPPQTGRR